MVICSYVLLAAPGFADALAPRIAALPGCEVVRARNRDVLLVVTEADDAGHDARLRDTLSAMEGVEALALSFGEVAETAKATTAATSPPGFRGA